jgi:hypothetical protein
MFGLPLLIGTIPIGDYRVFYDVETDFRMVTIQATRHQPPHVTAVGDPVKTMGIEQAVKD